MKLQHTSGAVIEDARIVEYEDFYLVNPVAGVFSQYHKEDWKRVPEGRWEKCKVEIERSTMDCIIVDGERWRNIDCYDKRRYTIIDGNLCVERRVEG